MKRLLVVSYFFPPLAGGGVHRVLAFTRHLPAFGWTCSVVCAGEDDYWVRDDSLLARVPRGTEVLRVPGGSALATWLRLRGGARGRRSGGAFAPLRALAAWTMLPDSYAGWARRARAAVAERLARGGVDAVLSSSPPDSAHLAAMGPAIAAGVPWVADFRDPWIGLHLQRPPTSWHRARHAALERRVLERASLVTVASRAHERTLGRASGGTPRAVMHLPNGFEPEPAVGAAPDPDHFRLAFTGTLSQMDDAGTLLDALHDLLAAHPEGRRRVRVDIAGPYDTDWEDRATALGLTGIVRFSGPVAHDDARGLQRAADALLLWRPRGPRFETMVPGKLYEYLDAGRPIVALLEPDDEAGELVRRAGGALVPPGDRVALARTLETLYIAWTREGRAPDARPAWIAEHERARLVERLARALDGLSGGAA